MRVLVWVLCVVLAGGFYVLDWQPKLLEIRVLDVNLEEVQQRLRNLPQEEKKLPELQARLADLEARLPEPGPLRAAVYLDENQDQAVRAQLEQAWKPLLEQGWSLESVEGVGMAYRVTLKGSRPRDRFWGDLGTLVEGPLPCVLRGADVKLQGQEMAGTVDLEVMPFYAPPAAR